MKRLCLLVMLATISNAFAEGQVFYRYGFSKLNDSRGGQTFTDTAGRMGKTTIRMEMVSEPVLTSNL